jgi:DNA-binding transcriptional LysR family regulator
MRMSTPASRLDWNRVRAFLATVEHGSLSGAARRLGLTQPTLSRQIVALERELGIALFERIGKSLSLTQAGGEMLEEVRAMGLAADRLALIASGQSQSLEGQVRVTASDIVSVYVLPPILDRLHKAWPGISIDVVTSNEISDLMRREADIAIRHVRPDQEGLIAVHCYDSSVRLYAAPRYLDRVGRPATPQDVARADFVGFSGDDQLLGELIRRGLPVTDRNFVWLTNNLVTAWEMVKQGLGIGVMLKEIADLTPGVEPVLPGFEPIPVPLWLATHRELHTSRRIRLVFEFLHEALSAPITDSDEARAPHA